SGPMMSSRCPGCTFKATLTASSAYSARFLSKSIKRLYARRKSEVGSRESDVESRESKVESQKSRVVSRRELARRVTFDFRLKNPPASDERVLHREVPIEHPEIRNAPGREPSEVSPGAPVGRGA